MKRLSSIVGLVPVLAAVTLLGACGGGSSSTSLDSFFPADNEVTGWTADPAGSAPQVAPDRDAAEALVDGDIAPFEAAPSPFVAFAMLKYVNGDYTNDFRIWEVADAAGCSSMYDYLVVNAPTFSSKTWSDESIGAQGRSATSAAFWWFNACVDKYFLESKVALAAGGQPDQAAHDLGLTFVQAVAAKIQ
ncbi:MAG: hypothetical protein HY906_17865 [Deltaproteobacteria bacterium]|nr:hypothetical protein [Deltaproteobacteria bacterium]